MRELLHIDPVYRAILHSTGLDRFDSILSCTRGDRLDKPGLEPWRERWRIPIADANSPACLYLKRFVRPPISRQMQRWLGGNFRHATAQIEFANTRALADHRIGAARAVAMGERLSGPIEHASFILLEEIKGESLESTACRFDAQRLRPDARAVEAIANLVARFHQNGFVHRDLYLCHIFLLEGRTGFAPDDYALIDLQRVFRPHWRRFRWIVKDLAALAFSTPSGLLGDWARLRFLVRYVRSHRGAGSARDLLPRIRRRVERMHRRAGRGSPESASSGATPVRSVDSYV